MKNFSKTLALLAALGLALASCSNTGGATNPISGDEEGPTTVTPTDGGTGSGGGQTTSPSTPTPTTPTTTQTSYIGSHKPSEAKAVGDIIFSDGSFERLSEVIVMPTAQASKAVAVIFYAGTSSDSLGEKTLGVGLNETQKIWAKQSAQGYWQTAADQSDGAANTSAIKAKSDYDEENYPAFYWADTYSATGFASGWHLPAKNELKALYDQKETVNSAVSAINNVFLYATALGSGKYWSSTESMQHYAWRYDFNNGEEECATKDTANLYVRAIRAF